MDTMKHRTAIIMMKPKTGAMALPHVYIDFTHDFRAGEVFSFSYSWVQEYMYQLSTNGVIEDYDNVRYDYVNYDYTAGWFDEAKIGQMTLIWNDPAGLTGDFTEGTVSGADSVTVQNGMTITASDLDYGYKMNVQVRYADWPTQLSEEYSANNVPDDSWNGSDDYYYDDDDAGDAIIGMMLEDKIAHASVAAMTVSNECLKKVYDNIDYFKSRITLRPSELSNSAELIHRFGVIAMNTALECDIYGNENSSHVCGSKLMNGIGGSCDYERNGSISIFYTPSTAKNGCISAIVPQCCHIDSTEHDVDVIITEQGIADLRGKGPARRAEEIINNCAHPDYRPLLREYQRIASQGHEPCALRAAFAFHDTLVNKGDMRLTDFGEYMG